MIKELKYISVHINKYTGIEDEGYLYNYMDIEDEEENLLLHHDFVNLVGDFMVDVRDGILRVGPSVKRRTKPIYYDTETHTLMDYKNYEKFKKGELILEDYD